MSEVKYPAILVVDDEPQVRKFAHLALQQDHVVLMADDGLRALEIAQQFPGEIGLLVSDLSMPRMGGLEAARRILSERPAIRVLLMSGDASSGLPLEDRRYSFIAKPFTVSTFRSAIKRAFSGEGLPERRPIQHCGDRASAIELWGE